MTGNPDKRFIERCFELALKGRGKVSPNPLVGAVILKNGKVVSEGWHSAFGREHAEAMAINKAQTDLSGSTLYCNLEPCIHTNKKTPPCYPLVVGAGIKRVVISNLDPNPEVAGKSVQKMREQGIEVVTDVLREKGLELNRFFFKHITQQQPWITLKVAQSVDGKISRSRSEQTWLTGEKSKKFVHTLRAQYDAVLTGSATVNADDPQLNVRLVKGRDPAIVILTARLNVNPRAALFKNADKKKILLICDENEMDAAKKMFSKNIRIIGCPVMRDGSFEMDRLLNLLYKENIGSLLVEGGQQVFSFFLKNDACDELVVLQAPMVLGDALPAFNLENSHALKLHSVETLAGDICFNLRKKDK